MKKRVKMAKDKMDAALRSRVPIVWWDNFNKQRYSRDPNKDQDQCINGAVMAVTGVDRDIAKGWAGWLKLRQIGMKFDDVTDFLVREQKSFTNDIRSLQLKSLTFDDGRVPCDLRRTGVSSAPWYTFAVSTDDVSSAPGLVAALRRLDGMKDALTDIAAVLCDVNVYYRIVKCTYR